MWLNFRHVIAAGTAHVLEDKCMLPCYAAQAPQGTPLQCDGSCIGSPFPQHLSLPLLHARGTAEGDTEPAAMASMHERG